MTIKPKDRAAEQAAKAAEAAEAARLAEEAAETARLAEEAAETARIAQEAAIAAREAREAARLAKIAADRAAAEAAEAAEAEQADEAPEEVEAADEDEEAEEATKSLQKPQDPSDDSEGASDGDSAPGDGSASPEDASAPADATKADEDPKSAAKSVKLRKTAARKTAKKAKAADSPRRRRFGSGSMGTVIAVLTVLVIAFGAGTVALALKVREQNATEAAGKDAAQAASHAAQKLSSYDYRTLDADLKEASATTTGKLHTDYDKLAQQLKTAAVQQQAVATTTVIKVGIVSATPDKVVALVYANRSSATKNDKQQQLPEPLRMRMTLLKQDDGKWLASELVVIS
ncbi:hypothetical protein [Actinomadura sp. 3N508]|uniref:hypothetical protein n=1 Tax=Actinomadura sp. 3N508 TaxID=3375153 RepID=UPI003795543A